jgi:hypothetical protein
MAIESPCNVVRFSAQALSKPQIDHRLDLLTSHIILNLQRFLLLLNIDLAGDSA